MKNSTSPSEESSILLDNPHFSRHKNSKSPGTSAAQERRRTEKLKSTLPELIRIGQWGNERAKSFFVRYGPERKLKSFATEIERNDFATTLAQKNEYYGAAMLEDFDLDEWQEFKRWKANSENRTPLVSKAVSDYLALRVHEGMVVDSDTHRHVTKHLGRLSAKFGPKHLDEIISDELREWLSALSNPRDGKPMSLVTIKNHRKDVNTFFERAVLEEWIGKNPCNRVKPPKIPEGNKEPLAPKLIFQLLHANLTEPVMGRIALELFGGLRYSSAGRLTKDHLDFESKGVAMPGQGHKSEKWKYREGHPSVLWEWLMIAPDNAFTAASVSNYGHLKTAAFLRAGFPNPGNTLRESFASYLLAQSKSYQLVGYLMQHTRVSTTMIYEGKAKKSEAELVFAMTPEAVKGTWEEFLSANSKSIKA